jgi:hypothetical protein
MHEAAGAGFDTAVQAEVDGVATEAQLAQLEANKGLWQLALERLLDDIEETLRSVRAIPGEERDQIVADFEDERAGIVRALVKLTGVPIPEHRSPDGHEPEVIGEVALQASWSMGRLVVWAGFLAIIAVVFAVEMTIQRLWPDGGHRHRALGRFTMAIYCILFVTGTTTYTMLYLLYPGKIG